MKENWLRAYRRTRGIGLEELASRTGVPLDVLEQVEGGAMPEAEKLKRLCQALEADGPGVPVFRHLRTAYELLATVCGNRRIVHEHDLHSDSEQVELFWSIVGHIQTIDMVWQDLGDASRHHEAVRLSDLMRESERLGIWWFGLATSDPGDPTSTVGLVYATAVGAGRLVER
ncbi:MULTISPECIES: helix-turn-helix transcriptional regulator [unclassified Exiguobacterium]|uniref:helix-turn-helix domain-containing protein n=1 Tax=unclassified Exiguobacterium TaxID=2644629 RepID=UPI00135C5CD9|nr:MULTISPECIES: helix-turn-helix transcriptional regulator [unclassified Exiguobacterium]